MSILVSFERISVDITRARGSVYTSCFTESVKMCEFVWVEVKGKMCLECIREYDNTERQGN